MAADESTVNSLVAAVRARADAGNDEAKLAWGTGSPITDPVLNGETVSGTFDQGNGIRDVDGGSNAMKAYLEGIADFQTDAVPPGAVSMYAGAGTPVGWLLCDGSAVSRSTYASLFAAIGTIYGVGNGTTTFNLPDFVAKFPRGGTPGTTGGSDSNSHAHEVPVGFDASTIYHSGSPNPQFGSAVSTQVASTIVRGAQVSQSVRNALTDTPSDTENRPAFLEMRFIVKT